MEDFREKLNNWYKENYQDGRNIIKKDYFCPMIKQMCVGNDCAFWLSNADDPHSFSDHPCSMNVMASHFLSQEERQNS
ncbi:hypothetical protein LCGC14_1743630 [marine sediment metagenome]|uniref:Uncharacterized protein n=1 Tax=marine sediment metagenome TaxID=412755 RepID=A0A0F9HTK7_9ZZZZ